MSEFPSFLRLNNIPLSASLVAQLVKNPPAMQETLVQFLGREDPTCSRATKPMHRNDGSAQAVPACSLQLEKKKSTRQQRPVQPLKKKKWGEKKEEEEASKILATVGAIRAG